jgi:class 3 adenylate cyclase
MIIIEKLKKLYDAYQTFLIGVFIGKYINKEQFSNEIVGELNNKITIQNLEIFRKASLVVILIEAILIFTYDLPKLESAGESDKFLYLGYLYAHIFLIALTVLCNILLYLPNYSVTGKLMFHHKLVVPIYSFFVLASSGYMDALNYYATKSMNLFIIIMFIQLVIFIFSLHFLAFLLTANFGILIYSLKFYNNIDDGIVNSIINIGILLIFAYISGYMRLRGFVRNEVIEKQKQALDVQTKLTNSFARFVPEEFLSFLNKVSIVEVGLGDQIQKQMSVLFSDIRSFTTISEKMSPQENFNFLNSYLKSIGPLIRSNKGFVDKYIGDAVMALFPDEPDFAVDTALAMQNVVLEYNQKRKAADEPIEIGIGIHYGKMILGTIGEERRMQNTVISDSVNLASRIESLTKYYGVGILISDLLWNQIVNKSKYQYRVIDTVIVKGKNQPVNLIEILNPNTYPYAIPALELQEKFENAIQVYKARKIEEAVLLFEDIDKILNSADRVTKIYLERCKDLLTNGIPADWTGVFKLDRK